MAESGSHWKLQERQPGGVGGLSSGQPLPGHEALPRRGGVSEGELGCRVPGREALLILRKVVSWAEAAALAQAPSGLLSFPREPPHQLL